jgi:hypothetical protein
MSDNSVMDGRAETDRYPWIWDYDLSRQEFDDILAGSLVKWGHLDRDWAAVRLIEYAGYREMINRVGYADFAREWPHWRARIRGEQFRATLDFLADWIQTRHPELMIYGSRQGVFPQSTLSAAR